MAKEPTERYASAGELGRDAAAATAAKRQALPGGGRRTHAAAERPARRRRAPTGAGRHGDRPWRDRTRPDCPRRNGCRRRGTKSAKRPPPPVRGTAATGAERGTVPAAHPPGPETGAAPRHS